MCFLPDVCPCLPCDCCESSIVPSIWNIFKSSSSKAISPQNTAEKETEKDIIRGHKHTIFGSTIDWWSMCWQTSLKLRSAWPELLADANLRFAGYAIDWQVNMRGNILGCQLALCSHTLRCWLQINKRMSGNIYIHPVAILPTLFTCPYHTCPNKINVQLQAWYHTFLNYPVAKEVLEMAMKKEIILGTTPFVCVSSFGREFTLQPWYKTINNEDYALSYLDCSILE